MFIFLIFQCCFDIFTKLFCYFDISILYTFFFLIRWRLISDVFESEHEKRLLYTSCFFLPYTLRPVKTCLKEARRNVFKYLDDITNYNVHRKIILASMYRERNTCVKKIRHSRLKFVSGCTSKCHQSYHNLRFARQ